MAEKEYIERAALIADCERAIKTANEYRMAVCNYEFIDIVKAQEAAEVVEVVRCKDCRYCFEQTCHEPRNRILFHVPDFGDHYRYAGRIRVPENHFCGFGERKEQTNG